MLSDDYEQEREELREKLLQLNEEMIQQEEQAENIDMIKGVYVHAPDNLSGHREQQIDISYDLVGILPASLLADL